MQSLISRIDTALSRGDSVALSTVVGRRGSLPMGRRAKMLIDADSTSHGTVGGGCLEAEIYAAGSALRQVGGARLDSFSLTEIEDGLHGHICGGTVTVLTEGLLPAASTVTLFARLRRAQEAREPVVLATLLPAGEGGSPATPTAEHVLVTGAGEALVDPEMVVPGELLRAAEAALRDGKAAVHEVHGRSYFVEPCLPQPTAVIFGAGHCGRAIGALASTAGFRVLVLDDRATFLDSAAMPWADEILQVDFETALQGVEVGAEPYYVIVTRGHDHDLCVLRQVLDLPGPYLGMIGSRRKRHLFERTLGGEGVSPEVLSRVRSPMGLPIAADTPEEIAVSVVGEMIAVRRGADGAPGTPAAGRDGRSA